MLKSPVISIGREVEIIQHVSLFKELRDNTEALAAIAKIMLVQNFPKGHSIIKEGEIGNELFILFQGQVSIQKKTPEGDNYKVAILNHEHFPALGEGGLVDAESRSATVTCDVDCGFLVLTKEKFDEFSMEYPAWALPIFKMISKALMGRLIKTSQDLLLVHKALLQEVRGH